MKAIINIILFVFLISFNFIATDTSKDEAPIINVDYPNITCGKNNPKKPTDCTKYGTDSGMLCCWVSYKQEKEENEQFCTLLSYKVAGENEIKGKKTFSKGEVKYRYWDCGNKSFYLNLNILFFFTSLLLFF